TLLVLDAYIVRRPVTGPETLAGLAFGIALGFVGGYDVITLTGLALLLVAPAVRLRAESPPEAPSTRGPGMLPGVLLTLPLTGAAACPPGRACSRASAPRPRSGRPSSPSQGRFP